MKKKNGKCYKNKTKSQEEVNNYCNARFDEKQTFRKSLFVW